MTSKIATPLWALIFIQWLVSGVKHLGPWLPLGQLWAAIPALGLLGGICGNCFQLNSFLCPILLPLLPWEWHSYRRAPQISSTLSFLSQAEIEKNNLHNSSVPLRLSNLSWLLKLLLTCRIIILAFTQFKFLFKWHVNWFKKTNSTTIFTMETAVPVLGLS